MCLFLSPNLPDDMKKIFENFFSELTETKAKLSRTEDRLEKVEFNLGETNSNLNYSNQRISLLTKVNRAVILRDYTRGLLDDNTAVVKRLREEETKKENEASKMGYRYKRRPTDNKV
jgi:hypothetical protein